MRVVIVGGGACGASAAARIRRLDESAEIIVLEKTGETSIANCGLPYYVSGVIDEREKILVSSPQKFKELFNIDVRIFSEVVDINAVIAEANEKKVEFFRTSAKTGFGVEELFQKIAEAVAAPPSVEQPAVEPVFQQPKPIDNPNHKKQCC